MTDTNEQPAKPKRGFTPEQRAKAVATRAANRAKRAGKAAKPAEKPSEFAGMTKANCADGCKPERCVISGHSYCAHPGKGGLHAGGQRDAAALARFNKAKDLLARQGT